MIAVVAGMIGTFPVGGVLWDYAQYALGLERLGIEVHYVEDTGCASYDPELGCYGDDPGYGVEFLRRELGKLSPTLGRRWGLRSVDGAFHGPEGDQMGDLVASADLFVNVSGGCVVRPEYLACTRKVLIDTDPGWNHFMVFPASEERAAEHGSPSFRAHDYFCTYAQNIGAPDCAIPTLGLPWHPTQPPVVMDQWEPGPIAERWTTVMSWDNYRQPVVHDGATYGSKERELWAVADLPSRVPVPFEIALGGVSPPVEELQRHGWLVRDSGEVSATAADYRRYVSSSRAEFSVAKNLYVATRSGWFSCRSSCYLAAGRPVVLQDTGFSKVVATGQGLLTFTTVEEAAAAVSEVEDNYAVHQKAARDIAARYFSSDVVLTDLLEHVGLG